MAIRYGSLKDSSLSARKLAATPAVLVASPAYLDRNGTPESPEALVDHPCLTLRQANVARDTWRLHGAAGERVMVDVPSALCGDGFLVRRWAVAGMGIALKSLFDVIDDLEEGRLDQILPHFSGATMPIHVVFPSRTFLPARVRALDTTIAALFERRQQRCDAWWQGTTSQVITETEDG